MRTSRSSARTATSSSSSSKAIRQVEAAQKRLAALLISPEVQVAFNNAKGSMPVRADVDMSTADPCMQKALKAVDDPAKIVTATNRFITENTNQQINELVTQFFADNSITADEARPGS